MSVQPGAYEVFFARAGRYVALDVTKFESAEETEAFALYLVAKHPEYIGQVEVRKFGTYGLSCPAPALGERSLEGSVL
ncbi:MAG: hypothetical protein ACRD1Z_11520 [Vicinamibacteria bacterium]